MTCDVTRHLSPFGPIRSFWWVVGGVPTYFCDSLLLGKALSQSIFPIPYINYNTADISRNQSLDSQQSVGFSIFIVIGYFLYSRSRCIHLFSIFPFLFLLSIDKRQIKKCKVGRSHCQAQPTKLSMHIAQLPSFLPLYNLGRPNFLFV